MTGNTSPSAMHLARCQLVAYSTTPRTSRNPSRGEFSRSSKNGPCPGDVGTKSVSQCQMDRSDRACRNNRPEFENPPTDRLIANRQSALSQEILDVPVAHCEPEVSQTACRMTSGGNRWRASEMGFMAQTDTCAGPLRVSVSMPDKAMKGASPKGRWSGLPYAAVAMIALGLSIFPELA